MNSNTSTFIVLFLIVVAVAVLAYVSYSTGYKQSENDFGSLLMTMKVDSNSVTTGLYEELPNNVRKTIQFYSNASNTSEKEVKLFADVKYIKVGTQVINAENGEIWKFIKNSSVFKRQFKDKNEKGNSNSKKGKKNIPNSKFASKLN